MTQEPKLCKDCKHFSDKATYASCYHPSVTNIDLYYGYVYGKEVHIMRSSHLCRPEAVLFEPKPSMLEKVIKFFKKG